MPGLETGEIVNLKVGSPALFGHVDNTIAQIYRSLTAPENIQQTFRVVTEGKGDNTTFIGVASGYFEARDKSDVAAGTKGVLYALSLAVCPIVGRNNVPFDDAVGLTISNVTGVTGAKATDGIYVSANTGTFGDKTTGTSEWYSIFTADANADVGIVLAGKIATYGIDLSYANLGTGAILVPNAKYLYSRNAAGSADLRLLGLNANNDLLLGEGNAMVTGALGVGITASLQGNIHLHAASGNSIIRITNAATGSGGSDGLYFGQLAGTGALLINQENASLVLGTNNASILTLTAAGDLSLAEAADLVFGTTTGTKIGGAANQKLGFYGATPIIQQTGVAETVAAIRTALINLGLITA